MAAGTSSRGVAIAIIGIVLSALVVIAILVDRYMKALRFRELVERSSRGEPFYWNTDQDYGALDSANLEAAEIQVSSHPDWTSYHVLLVLRKYHAGRYGRLPLRTKAAVLSSGLARVKELNDWGHLEPEGSYEAFAAKALLEVGAAALPYLRPLLDDQSSAFLGGSEEATLSRLYGYRRADFAYNYVCQILGTKPKFDPDPSERDKEIEQLKRKLDGKLNQPTHGGR